MKKRNISQKLRIHKSKIASFNQINVLIGGINSIAPDRCDFIRTMNCPSNGCPPGSNGCPPNSNNCPPETVDCPSANTNCFCDSFITDPGITGC